jgi:hypothetical protein
LIACGKEHWLTKREGKVTSRGKEELEVSAFMSYTCLLFLTSRQQTYWLNLDGADERMHSSGQSADSHQEDSRHKRTELYPDDKTAGPTLSEQDRRLVGFNVELIIRLIGDITAKREQLRAETELVFVPTIVRNDGETIFDEIQDVIVHPGISDIIKRASGKLPVSRELIGEVNLFVSQLALLYRNELPYHNLEHSSHTALVSRVSEMTMLDDAHVSRGLANP